METTLEQLKEQWSACEHYDGINWMSAGNNLQRHFYRLNSIHITQNTFFPYNWLKNPSEYFWIDMLVKNTKENRALLKTYKAKINMDCSYTEQLNVGVPQFDNEDGMLRFIHDGLVDKLNNIPNL